MADHQVVGKVGRVTAPITPGHMGEVMISVRGGTEAYNAYGHKPDDHIAKGSRVVVVEYMPPRTVVVSDDTFD